MTGEPAKIDWDALARAAEEVRGRAHAPYSKYPVGAALLVASGRVFVGCNVENASYGLAICAERSVIVQMVAAGERDPIALAVMTRGPMIGTPCGTCRQTLAEFAMDLPILLFADPCLLELGYSLFKFVKRQNGIHFLLA